MAEPTGSGSGESWKLSSTEVKEQVYRGLIDFKNVFLFPLCTGIMTGVGFIAGKKLAEGWFYPKEKAASM